MRLTSFLVHKFNVKGWLIPEIHKGSQSPTQWAPLTSRINLCQSLTVLQDSCKTHLCSRFCILEAIFLFEYIFSCDIKYNTCIIIWAENTVWNWQYIWELYCSVPILCNLVYVFIRKNENIDPIMDLSARCLYIVTLL